ncbi:hypothetical protein [Halococcus hamelinensis]|nr:hypothetical protein [Halococcus hamelinensis]
MHHHYRLPTSEQEAEEESELVDGMDELTGEQRPILDRLADD